MIQLVCFFDSAEPGFLDRARPVLALLNSQPACLSLRMSRSTEDPHRWVLTAEFPSFAGYRGALSPFDVRTLVIPFLSEADQSSAAVLEVALSGVDGVLTEHELLVDHADP